MNNWSGIDDAPSPKLVVAIDKMAQVKDHLLSAGYHPGEDVVVITGDSRLGAGVEVDDASALGSSVGSTGHQSIFPSSLVQHLTLFQQAEQRKTKTTSYKALFSFMSFFPHVFPTDLSLERNPFGKPFWYLANIDFPLGFSLSDAGPYWALGIGPQQLGIDIEQYKNIPDWPQLARACFSLAELTLFPHFEAAPTPDALFTLWTRKEALLKWRGKGMPDHLPAWCTATNPFGLSFEAKNEAQLNEQKPPDLQFFSWMPQPKLFAALCLPKGPQRFFFFSILQA